MKRTCLLTSLLCTVFIISAQSPIRLGLNEALLYADQHNTNHKNAQLDIGIAKETIKQTASYGLPQISLSANYQHFLKIPGNYAPNIFDKSAGAPEFLFLQFQQEYQSSSSLSVSQLLFDGTYLVGLQATKAFLELNELLKLKTQTDMHLAVSKSYLTALSTQKNLRLIDANIQLLAKNRQDVVELYKEGFAESLDVDRLTLALNNLNLQRDRLENTIEITKNALKIQMGMPVESSIELTDSIESLEELLLVEESNLGTFSPNNRIEHKLLNQGILLNNLDKKRFKASSLPSLLAFYQFQKNTNRSDFNFFQANLAKNNDWVPSSLYGASLKLPIFAGGLTRSKIKEIDIKLNKTKNEMDNFDRFAILDYTNAKQSYGLAIKIVVNQKENVALAQRIFDKSTIKYKEGVGSTLEVIQAQTDLQSAFNNYMNALNDLVLAKIDYRNACGKTLE
ncbi:MAG: hypothetical protein CK532_04725 [Flavobacteriales bacterium]|nr:MAG: hypothetical protein CK532_04725 [Flavobacteriales bacterium]